MGPAASDSQPIASTLEQVSRQLTDSKSSSNRYKSSTGYEGTDIVAGSEELDESGDHCDPGTKNHTPPTTCPVSLCTKVSWKNNDMIRTDCDKLIDRVVSGDTYERTGEEPPGNDTTDRIRCVDQTDIMRVLDMSAVDLSLTY